MVQYKIKSEITEFLVSSLVDCENAKDENATRPSNFSKESKLDYHLSLLFSLLSTGAIMAIMLY